MAEKKSINMYWYRLPSMEKNFGDELGPYIVGKLSGLKINYVPVVAKPMNTIKYFFEELFSKRANVNYLKYVFLAIPKKEVLVTIGSVISFVYHPSTKVWGAGIIKRDVKINNAKFYAVRGKYTQKRLIESGFSAPNVIGDPALLLPIIYKQQKPKKFKIGVIPHYVHYKEAVKAFEASGYLVINLLSPVETVIDQILSCSYIFSTSLHGLIVSHAYEVPALWCTLNINGKLGGDNVKFFDYFSSVDIPEYSAIDISGLSESELECVLENNTNKSLIQNDLRKLQSDLLNSAPFPIKSNPFMDGIMKNKK